MSHPPDPTNTVQLWRQRFPGALSLVTQENNVPTGGGRWQYTAWVRLACHAPPWVQTTTFSAIADSKTDARKFVCVQILHWIKDQKMTTLEKHPQPCEGCRLLGPVRMEPPISALEPTLLDSGLAALHCHMQALGLTLPRVQRCDQNQTLALVHPLLLREELKLSFDYVSPACFPTVVLKQLCQTATAMLDEKRVATYIRHGLHLISCDFNLVMSEAKVVHTSDVKVLQTWLTPVPLAQELMFDTEWDGRRRGNQLVLLTFCKSAQEVLLFELQPKQLYWPGVATALSQALAGRKLVCLDKSMETMALQVVRAKAKQRPAPPLATLTDLAEVVATEWPGISRYAGLWRCCQWFLGVDISGYKLDFGAMQKKHISWHSVYKNKALWNHAVSDVLALWQLHQQVAKDMASALSKLKL